ncbi:uncharacterized protein N7484_007756 [Penicillium longicatenatum]|uniref:uncharacterized protein n=1 Tax=Penicillium longicatenatum TaxID=1561947 RepID=UPI0025482C23|nr:uncharacterized protein N7484_007756 [Penicillium longicatenatum]KAJ5639894.1 hypothetical protein N7484_007756 [Penicillium longicatenatum]
MLEILDQHTFTESIPLGRGQGMDSSACSPTKQTDVGPSDRSQSRAIRGRVSHSITVVATGDALFHRMVATVTNWDIFYDASLDKLPYGPWL